MMNFRAMLGGSMSSSNSASPVSGGAPVVIESAQIAVGSSAPVEVQRLPSVAELYEALTPRPGLVDRLAERCVQLMARERERATRRAFFRAWRELVYEKAPMSTSDLRIRKLQAEIAYGERSLEGARQVIDEQQRKIGDQAQRLGALEKDHVALTSEGHKAHAFMSIVDEQTRAISALQLQMAAMARLELNTGQEHSRMLASTAVHLADQARMLLLAMRDREKRLEAEAEAETAAVLSIPADLELQLQRVLAEKAHLEHALAGGRQSNGDGQLPRLSPAALSPSASLTSPLSGLRRSRERSRTTLGDALTQLFVEHAHSREHHRTHSAGTPGGDMGTPRSSPSVARSLTVPPLHASTHAHSR